MGQKDSVPNYDSLDSESWAINPMKNDENEKIRKTYLPATYILNGQEFKWEDKHPQGLVDCFYVHPTTKIITFKHNATLKSELKSKMNRFCFYYQASVFEGITNIYAPFYRAASLRMYFKGDDKHKKGKKAFDQAYEDVKNAFYSFLKLSKKKGFVLASHSQGSGHIIRLLKEEVDSNTVKAAEIRKRMICAYIVGWGVGNDTFENGNIKASICANEVGPIFINFSTTSLQGSKNSHIYKHGRKGQQNLK